MNSIKEKEPAPLPSYVSPFIKSLIDKILDKNPLTRPDAKTLINSCKVI
jgi:hypothetical protein